MNAQKLTEKSLEAVRAANGIAVEQQNNMIQQLHLFLALLSQEGGLIPQLFQTMNVAVDNVKMEVQSKINNLPSVTGSARKADEVYIAQDVDRAFQEAEKEAAKMQDEYISVEHLMLGLFDVPDRDLKEHFS